MSNFSLLSEEEYKKICSKIPYKVVITYFRRYPKPFSQVCPGFRPDSLQRKDVMRVLTTHRTHRFICSFIETIVNEWLNQIQTYVHEYQNNGESSDTAYIHALYQSEFSDNISAYFKLIGADFSEDQLEMMIGAVSLLINLDDKCHKMDIARKELEEKNQTVERKVTKNVEALDEAERTITELRGRLKDCNSIQDEYRTLSQSYEQAVAERDSAISQVNQLTHQLSSLNEVLDNLQTEKAELEISIREKIEQEKEAATLFIKPSFHCAPLNMAEFEEYLAYNLDSIGIADANIPINKLVVSFFSSVLFRGKPIICNESYAATLARCISNTLTGNAPINHITYAPELSGRQISESIVMTDLPPTKPAISVLLSFQTRTYLQ